MPISPTPRNFVLQWLALGIVLLSLSVNFGYLMLQDRERTISDENERLINRTRIVSENVGAELESIKAVLTHTRDLMAGWKAHPEGRRLATEHLVELSEAMLVVRTLLILDADGAVFASNRKELEGQNFRERGYFVRVARNPSAATLYIGEPFQTALGVYAMNVLSMIPQANGEFGGVVSVTLNADRFRVLLESVRYRQEVSAGLVHGSGRIFVMQPAVPNVQRLDLAQPGTLFSRHRDSGKALALVEGVDAVLGKYRMGAFATIRPPALQMDTALVVGIVRDRDTLLEDWQERVHQQTLLILLFAAASIAGTVAYQRRSKQRKIGEVELADARRLSDDIIRSLPGIFYMVDMDGRLVRWNARFAAVTGYADSELKDKPALEVIAPADRELVGGHIRQVFEQGESNAEAGLLGKDGTTIPYRFSGERITINDVPCLIGVGDDITARKQLEDQARQLAFHDPLTQLPNRRLIKDRLTQTMAGSKRTGCHGALMFLDLDNFKPLNDRHGHEAGDLLLIAVAERLRSCVREVDTVGRFGGDEFIVILSELNASSDSSVKQARIVAEKVCASLAEPYRLELQREGQAASVIEHRCTASVGVALFLDHEPSQDDLIKLADTAMYQAKAAGRNQVRFSEYSGA